MTHTPGENFSVSWQTFLLSRSKSSLLCLSEFHKIYLVLSLGLFLFLHQHSLFTNKYVHTKQSLLRTSKCLLCGSRHGRVWGRSSWWGQAHTPGMPLPASRVPWPGEGVWGVLNPKRPRCSQTGFQFPAHTSTTQVGGHSRGERGLRVSS